MCCMFVSLSAANVHDMPAMPQQFSSYRPATVPMKPLTSVCLFLGMIMRSMLTLTLLPQP